MPLQAESMIVRAVAPAQAMQAPIILKGREGGNPVVFATSIDEAAGLFDGVILYDSVGGVGRYATGFLLGVYEPFKGSVTLTNRTVPA
jgi:hypothetical protein